MKTASDKVSDTKSFDDELGDDFLTSWKPSKMRLDAGLDLDEGVNSKASRKKFTLSKLDMDFDFDGGFGKLADFDVDLSGLDLPSSPVKIKSTSGKKAVEKLVERKHKSEDPDDDFDFNEFKTFGMDDSFLNKKPEGRLHGQTFDLAEIKTIPNSSSCQQNARRTTSIAFSDDLFSTDQDKKEVNLQGLEKSSEVELNNTRLSAKDIIADIVSHSAESGKDADKTERSGAVQSSQNIKTIKNWTEKEDAPPFDQTVAKLTTKPSDPQVNSIGRSHSREVSFTVFTAKAHKLEVCAFDSLMGLREAQEDAILTSNFKSTDEACGVTSTNSKVPPPQSSVAADDHDTTRLEKSTNFVESDKQLVKSILTNRRTSSLNQESEEKLSNLVLCDEDPKNNDLKRRDSCGKSNVACQNADLNGNIAPPNQRDEDSTGKTGQELLSEDRSMSAHEHGHPPHSLKDDDDFVTNANYVPHEAATTSSKSPDDSVLHKEIPGVPRPAEFNKAEKNSKSWEPLADELVQQETRCEQLPAVNTLDVIPQILAKSLHGPAVSCANDSQVQVISIPSTVHLKSPSSVAALRHTSSPSAIRSLKKTEKNVTPDKKAGKGLEGSATSITSLSTVKVDIQRQLLASSKVTNQPRQLLGSFKATNLEQSRLINTKNSAVSNAKSPSKSQEMKTSPAKICMRKPSALYSLKTDRFKTGNEHPEGLRNEKLQAETSVIIKSPHAASCASIEEKNSSATGLRKTCSSSVFQARSDVRLARRTPLSPTPPQKRKPIQLKEKLGASPSKKAVGASSLPRNKTDGLVSKETSRHALKFEEYDSVKSLPGGWPSVQLEKKQERSAQCISATSVESTRHDQSAQVSPTVKQCIIMQSIPGTPNVTDADIVMENDDIIESADQYSKEIEDLCKLLRKKHEEAKDLFVRALVTNNLLLMLSNPMNEDKIKGIAKSISNILSDDNVLEE
ncbi:hypothetical protein O6H91_06G117800 [Diphasiastrum complanatum]|uniref:Uncharacterized protein n=1 Tax=Diphasiastrum complanatum TaxID=34168 RepID=A0ACC2DI47_DIPCM|nr:hypothetical protein O6H91_06G117800 [Diphasiastrum complanatum]